MEVKGAEGGKGKEGKGSGGDFVCIFDSINLREWLNSKTSLSIYPRALVFLLEVDH